MIDSLDARVRGPGPPSHRGDRPFRRRSRLDVAARGPRRRGRRRPRRARRCSRRTWSSGSSSPTPERVADLVPQLIGAAHAAPGRVRRPRPDPGPRAPGQPAQDPARGKKEWEQTFDAILDPIMRARRRRARDPREPQLARALGRRIAGDPSAQPYAELLGPAVADGRSLPGRARRSHRGEPGRRPARATRRRATRACPGCTR